MARFDNLQDRWFVHRTIRGGSAFLAAVAIGAASPAAAQIVLDGRLGPAGPLAGPNFAVTAGLGQQVGGNLFHSFSQFNVGAGQSATFSGPGTVTNVIGRVTGGTASSINGLLQSTIAGANLWFINPAGIVFGPNAQLSVSGSFHASTASYLKLGNGGRFDAANPGASVLTSAAPSAFGFVGPAPAPIAVNGATLQAPDGKTLSLVGGNVTINGATLAAPAGQINLASAASAGEIAPGPTGIVATAAQLGSITVSDSTIHTNSVPGLPSGSIHIRGGKLSMSDSLVFSDNSEAGAGGGIRADVTGDMLLDNASLSTWSLGPGSGGDVAVFANRLTMLNGGDLSTEAFAAGRGGNLLVNAAESVSISGRNAGGFRSGLRAQSSGAGAAGDISVVAGKVELNDALIAATTSGAGNAGDIGIEAGELHLKSGAEISASTFGAGNGGRLSIATTGPVTLSGINSAGFKSGLYSTAQTRSIGASTGNAGEILVVAPLLVVDRGIISSISGAVSGGTNTGNAGNISLRVGRLSLVNGGQANTTTFTAGRGGDLAVSASESITIAGFSTHFISGLVSSATDIGSGGSILVTTPHLLLDGGIIATGTLRNGDAGKATVKVGRADFVNGGRIDASTFAIGKGGAVDLSVSDTLTISGRRDAVATETILREFVRAIFGNLVNDLTYAIIRPAFGDFASSGVFSRSVFAGNSGAINISAGNALVEKGGRINAQASNSGNAGTITLNVVSTLKLLDDGAITTQAAIGDGGDIHITARDLIYLRDSQITTAVGQGQGNGGNIFIDPIFVLLDGSRIIANAFGGNGGNINIVSDYFIVSGDSLVQASSRFGVSGTITTAPPNADVNAALADLPSAFLDASQLLRESCAARAGRAANSFTGVGRGGLPPSPTRIDFGSYAPQPAAAASAGMLLLAGVGCL